MSKIFGIGLSKTGTTSLAHALRILGYSVTEGHIEPIAEHDCGTDIYFAEAFKKLDRAYPGSKFIYTQRDMEPWLRSCQQHWRYIALADGWQTLRRRGPSNPEQRAIFKKVYGQAEFDETVFRETYQHHETEILSYFKGREQDLLAWNLCNDPAWERLCNFLERPTSDAPFPRTRLNVGPAQFYKEAAINAVKRTALLFTPSP